MNLIRVVQIADILDLDEICETKTEFGTNLTRTRMDGTKKNATLFNPTKW